MTRRFRHRSARGRLRPLIFTDAFVAVLWFGRLVRRWSSSVGRRGGCRRRLSGRRRASWTMSRRQRHGNNDGRVPVAAGAGVGRRRAGSRRTSPRRRAVRPASRRRRFGKSRAAPPAVHPCRWRRGSPRNPQCNRGRSGRRKATTDRREPPFPGVLSHVREAALHQILIAGVDGGLDQIVKPVAKERTTRLQQAQAEQQAESGLLHGNRSFDNSAPQRSATEGVGEPPVSLSV